MQTINRLIRDKIFLFLYLTPLVYFIIGNYFRYILGDLSLRSLDPDYIYFITGLGISEGHFNVFHVDNPGTPLQYLLGITYRMIHLLRPGNASYLEDVMMNSDLYLAVSNMLITGLTSLLLIYAGKRIYKTTGSVLYGILIQTTPYLAVIWYDIIGRIVPELLMPFPVILLEILLIETVYSQKKADEKPLIVALAAISALGLSVKLTYLPLWFIPAIIIPRWKNKALFTGLAIMFFLAFAIPVTLRLGVFIGWIKALFIHSGQYGGGEANFINWTELAANLKVLWAYEQWFLVTAMISILTAVTYLIVQREKAEQKLIWITVAVVLTVLLQTFMVGKHFEHRYYIPALLLLPLLVFLISEMLRRLLGNKLQFLVSIGLSVFFIFFIVHQLPWLKLKAETMSNDMAQRQETRNFVAGLNPNSIKIITTKNYGSPFKEYALMISYAWSGGHQKYYTETLAKLFPDSYLFFTWDNTFRFWGTELTLAKIKNSNKPLYVYLENDDQELYLKTIEKMGIVNDSIKFVPQLLFTNTKTRETIYQLSFDQTEAASLPMK
jgi:hypothetical protein